MGYFDQFTLNQSDRPVGVINNKTGKEIGSVQGHHLIPTVAANKFTWLIDLSNARDPNNNKYYDHGNNNNKIWLPISGTDALELGFASHSGMHVKLYTDLSEKVLTQIGDERARKIADLGLKQPPLSQTEIYHQANEEAAAKLLGFQNWLRASLVSGIHDGANGETYIRPALALNSADDKNLSLDNSTVTSRYDKIKISTFSLKDIENNYWYKMGAMENKSSYGLDLFKLKPTTGNALTSIERALARVKLEDPTSPFAKMDVNTFEKTFGLANKIIKNVDGSANQFVALAAGISAAGILKIAHDNGITLEEAMDYVKAKFPTFFSLESASAILQGVALEGAKARFVYMVAGPPGLAIYAAVEAYSAARTTIDILAIAFPEQPIWSILDSALDKFEARVGSEVLGAIDSSLNWLNIDLVVLDGATAGQSAQGGERTDLMWGQGSSVLKAGAGNDWAIHSGNGSAFGEAGNDKLISLDASFLSGQGATLNGGEGNDWLISFGGHGSKLYGGEGSDWLFNWNGKDSNGNTGQGFLWGGDGATKDNSKDTFTVSNGTFVMDAGTEDIITWGLPFFRVTGGTQLAWQEDGYAYWQPFSSITSIGGIASVVGGGILSAAFAIADVATALTFRFSLTFTNQLVIDFGRGRGGTAVIENYNLNLETGAATGNVVVFKQEYTDKGTIDTLTQYLNLALRAGFGLCSIGTDPIVIDLDGDGLDLTAGVTNYFDLNADGFAEKAAWVKGDDGFLVRDLNNNGKIDNIGEMFGTATTPGHTALKALDANNDNRLTSADTAFASLRVWQDLNGNGVTDAGELKTLSQLGITSIATTGAAPTTANVRGNTIRAESNVTFANGTTRKAVDVMLNSNPADTKWLGSNTVSAAAAALPELKGYGTIADLRVKMTTDATLLTRVDAVAKMAATSTWTQILGLTDDVLFRWAGVDGVAATAMGTGFDRQKLAFLEKYLGTQLTPRDAAGVPALDNVRDLINTWDKVLADTAARLAVQGPLKTVFSGFTFDKGSDELRATSATSLSDTLVKIFAQLSTVSATAQTQWNTSWAPLLTAFVDAAVRLDTNAVRSDFVVASLMRAMDGRTNALTLKNFVDGLALQNVQFGTSGNDNLNRTGNDMVIMVGDAGNDNYDGSGGQTVYVFGKGFGQDVITDVDAGAFGDRIRFALLNDNQVTLSRSGVDLLIKVNGTTDQILVRNQFVNLKNGIEEIQFANGKIFTTGEIAEAVGKGTAASETLVGSAMNDELEGLGGNDILQGGDGGDLYYFSRGHGQDRIEDNQTTPLNQSADTLLIENGYTMDDAILTRTGNSNDLVLTFKGTTDKITIVGQFFYNSLGIRGGEQTIGMVGDFLNTGFFGGNKLALDSRIEGIFFKSGGGWSWGDIQTKLIAQATTKGNDVVWGFGTADVFYASSGNDLLQGRDGSDTYHFARGAGQDTIFDQAEFVTIASNDSVKLIGGLKKTDITLSRVANTNDLLIKIVGTTDTLTIKEQFGGRKIDLFGFFDIQWNNRVEEFLFDDGSKYTWTDILAILTQGTAGNDTLVGDFNVDTLDGKAGNDFLDGGDMGDIYLFGKGDGKDIIHDRPSWVIDSGVDTVKFKTGVTFAETKFLLDRLTGDLVITFAGTPDELRVKGHFNLTQAGPFGELAPNRIEQFEWADGTKRTWADISAAAVAAQATAGNDTIGGTQGDDRIDGGLGNDRLLGGDGSDTYVFGSGKGNDTISDFLNNILSGNADVVEFGAGITLANLKLDRIGTNLNDLRITLATGETLTIEGQFAFNSLGWSANQIETFRFANGTTLSATGLQQTLLSRQGTAGADTITGFATNDTLIGGAGNDILRGGEGSDTYRFAPGFGVDVIEEASGNILDSDFDVVQFEAGITAANTRVSRSGDDLIFTFVGSTDSLRMKGQFTPFNFFGAFNDIEQFRFADGTVWSDADVRARVLSQAKTAGNDTITGFFTADTLDGGAGNDILRGSSGSDTYVFGKGYGQDQIQESVDHHPFLDGTDTLAFDASVLKTDVRFAQVGTDLVATILSTGEAIRVVGHFLNANSRIELVTFADGTKLSREQFEANALSGAGTSGNDTITGSNGDNVLDGGAGNDTLRGGDGNDTYVFGRGYGQDIVDEATGWDGEYDDKIVFGAGISLNNLVTTRSGNDLIIQIAGTTDQLTVLGQFTSTNSGSPWGTQRIEKFVFADGSVLTGADIDLRILQSLKTSGADTVLGYDSSDIIDGGAGNDMLIGGDGNDTYYFGRGYGSDTVSENSGALGELDDRIQFTSSVRPEDLLLSRDGNNLIIKIKNTTDQLTVLGQFTSTNSDWVWGNYRIEKFCFANGLIWTAADIDRMVLEAMKTAGADTVTGYDADEVIDGGAGNDTLIGGDGNDTYVWGRGYGSDIVSENSGTWGELDDKIRFAPGVNPSDLLLSRDGNTLIIKIKNTTDQLSILGQFSSTYSDGLWGSYRIEKFLFSNGTIWSAAEIDVMMIQAAQTSGNDTIMGYDGNDRLDGGAGNDTLAGYRGDDTYIFGRGYGQDYIDESSGSFDDANDVILFKEGIAPTDLLLSRSGTALVIRIAGTTDQLTIAHQLWNSSTNGGAGNRIERFVFANGLVWTASEVDLRVLQAQQTAGDDVVSGYDGNDVLDGGRGNDTLMAARGNDTYVFGRGYGQDRVDDWAGNYGDIDDIILFKAGIAPTDLLLSRSGLDLVIKIAGTTDQLTIVNQFFTSYLGGYGSGNRIERFVFANGVVWTASEIDQRVLLGQKTAGDDEVRGYDTNDVLDGGLGNDTLSGFGGEDTYVFGRGYGNDIVNEATGVFGGPNDTVRFLSGISASDLQVSYSGGNLVVRITGTTDTLTIINQHKDYAGGGNRIERFLFADGSMLSANEIDVLILRGLVGAIFGTANADTYNGTANADLYFGEAGNDTISGNAGNDTLSGVAGNDTLNGGEGSDILVGGDGNDVFVLSTNVGGEYDSLLGGNGSDTANLSGFVSAIEFRLDDARNEIYTRDGADLWNGNWRAMGRWEGIENITGTAFADRLYGDNGSNTLNGGAGNDEICGLGGNDVLTGGLGGDVFYFATGFGNDRITDFAAGTAGTDVIRLSIGAAFDSFAEISAAATQVGADTVITFDANTKITLTNVAKTSLAADDFQFS
jgi:Ca2+-binding RTX toxin-like protein